MSKIYFVYIITNKPHGTLYTGVTSNLEQRMYQHKHKVVEGFSKKYGLDKLVWFAETTDVYEAINQEKRMKKWQRQYKINLIEAENPAWKDLSQDWFDS